MKPPVQLVGLDLRLVRKCVTASLELRESFVLGYKDQMENIPNAVEPKTRRNYMRLVATEIPQLRRLLQHLKGK